MQVLSMAADHVIKVWDLRTQGCLQTIAPADWVAPEDANPTAMSYDVTRKRMVSIKHKPAIWQHKCISDQSSAHQAALVGALVNTTFDVVSEFVLLPTVYMQMECMLHASMVYLPNMMEP